MTDWRNMSHSAFDQPWQVSLFALTGALSEAGAFSWREWSESLADRLAASGVRQPPYSNEDYYCAWLAALETLLASKDLARPQEIDQLARDWRHAHLNAAHGAIVALD